MVGHIC